MSLVRKAGRQDGRAGEPPKYPLSQVYMAGWREGRGPTWAQ